MARSSPQRVRPQKQPASVRHSPVSAASPQPRSFSVPAFSTSLVYSIQPGIGNNPPIIKRSAYDPSQGYPSAQEAPRDRQRTIQIPIGTQTSRSQLPAVSVSRQSSSVPMRHATRSVVNNRITILVVGLTGVGKSAFISQLIRSGTRAGSFDRPVIGHALESCTAQVTEYTCVVDGQEYALVDTPGFDDTRRSDTDVLQSISDYLTFHYQHGRRIHGVIFLHRILDTRLSASSIKVAEIVKRICGQDFYPYVALVTTMWQLLPDRGRGKQREKDLLDHPRFWKDFHDGRAKHFQSNSRECGAETILRDFAFVIAANDRELVENGKRVPVLQIQTQMCKEGRSMANTAAGDFLEGELRRRKEKHQQEIQRLKDEIRQASQEKDMDSTRMLSQSLGAKLVQMKKDENDLDRLRVAKNRLYVQKDREEFVSRSYPESSDDSFSTSRSQHNVRRGASFLEQEPSHDDEPDSRYTYRADKIHEYSLPSEDARVSALQTPGTQNAMSRKAGKIQRMVANPHSAQWRCHTLCETRRVPKKDSRRRAPSR